MSLLTDLKLEYTFFEEYEPPVAAIIVAAGSALRMGSNKQFAPVLGVPVIARTLLAFQNSEVIRDIVVVAREDDIADIQRICEEYGISKLTAVVKGGEERQYSVYNGVLAASPDIEYYAIHDGARPLVSNEEIVNTVKTAMEKGACAVGVKVKDTIKRINIENRIVETPRRENLIMIRTPQVFEAKLFKQAMRKVKEDGIEITDDCAAFEYAGFNVFVVEGSYENIKITTPDDIPIAEAILLKRGGQND